MGFIQAGATISASHTSLPPTRLFIPALRGAEQRQNLLTHMDL